MGRIYWSRFREFFSWETCVAACRNHLVQTGKNPKAASCWGLCCLLVEVLWYTFFVILSMTWNLKVYQQVGRLNGQVFSGILEFSGYAWCTKQRKHPHDIAAVINLDNMPINILTTSKAICGNVLATNMALRHNGFKLFFCILRQFGSNAVPPLGM